MQRIKGKGKDEEGGGDEHHGFIKTTLMGKGRGGGNKKGSLAGKVNLL